MSEPFESLALKRRGQAASFFREFSVGWGNLPENKKNGDLRASMPQTAVIKGVFLKLYS